MNKGIKLILMVALVQATMLTLVKFASFGLTTAMQVLTYCGFPLLFYIPKIRKKGIQYFVTKHLLFFLVRGLLSTVAVFFFFYAAQHIHLGIASIFYNSSPIFIPLLAFLFLSEKTSCFIYLSILIAIVGVVIIIDPSLSSLESPVIFIALASGILMAIQQTMLRFVAKERIATDIILFYQCIACTVSSCIILLVESHFNNKLSVVHHFTQFQVFIIICLIILLGSLSYLAQYLVTRAFGYMQASKLAPFLLASVPISSFYGWVFWHQHLSIRVVVGMFITFIGILFISKEQEIKLINFKLNYSKK